MRPFDDEEQMLEKLREKLGPTRKVDERSELERLFGKKQETEEDRLRKKLVKPTLKVGDIIDINIEKLAFGGEGLGKSGAYPVFVPDTVPGDAVRVKLNHVTRDLCRAEIVEMLARSSNRVPARCPLFGQCGGCQIQSLVYTAQLKAKQVMAKDVLKRIGGIETSVRNVIRSSDSFHYRIRTRLQVAQVNGQLQVGYFARHSKKIVPLTHCPLLVDSINTVIAKLPEILPAPGTAPIPHEVHLQTAIQGESVVVHLVGKETIHGVDAVLDRCKLLKLPVTGVSSSHKNKILTAGDVQQQSTIGNTTLLTSGDTFIQANRFQSRRMLDQAIMLSSPAADDTVLDLYCGSGFFSLAIAPFVQSVTGLEGSTAAISNAIDSAEINGLTNTHFIACRDNRFFDLPDLRKKRFSLVVADPPRAGLSPETLKALIKMKPAKFLYVSCNPSTLARDLKALVAEDFRIRVIQPVDMFPHTYHLENLVFLTHRYTGAQAANQAFMDLR